MKYRYFGLIVISIVGLFGLTSWFNTTGKNNTSRKLELKITSAKEKLIPGEVVSLTVIATNKSDEIIKMLDGLSPEHGYLNFLISQDGQNYKKYKHPKWGRRDSKLFSVLLKPGESINASANILWNLKPEFDASQLAPETVKAVTEGRILTDYVFPKPGVYYIKAVYSVYFIDGQDKYVQIDSKPIQVTIEKPEGEDLEVWNQIKDNGEIGFFLQEGDFRNPYDEKSKELKQKIEQIVIQHPNSIYADFFQRKLEKFRENEAKRENSIYKPNRD